MDWVEARNDGQTTLSIEGLLTYSDSYLYDILYEDFVPADHDG